MEITDCLLKIKSTNGEFQAQKKPLARLDGAEGRTRTDTLLRVADFESAASTDFATSARSRNRKLLHYTATLILCNNY